MALVNETTPAPTHLLRARIFFLFLRCFLMRFFFHLSRTGGGGSVPVKLEWRSVKGHVRPTPQQTRRDAIHC